MRFGHDACSLLLRLVVARRHSRRGVAPCTSRPPGPDSSACYRNRHHPRSPAAVHTTCRSRGRRCRYLGNRDQDAAPDRQVKRRGRVTGCCATRGARRRTTARASASSNPSRRQSGCHLIRASRSAWPGRRPAACACAHQDVDRGRLGRGATSPADDAADGVSALEDAPTLMADETVNGVVRTFDHRRIECREFILRSPCPPAPRSGDVAGLGPGLAKGGASVHNFAAEARSWPSVLITRTSS